MNIQLAGPPELEKTLSIMRDLYERYHDDAAFIADLPAVLMSAYLRHREDVFRFLNRYRAELVAARQAYDLVKLFENNSC